MEKEIKKAVMALVAAGTPFTSVDVTNRIKTSGKWVRVSEAAPVLADNVGAWAGWETTRLDIGGGIQANVFHAAGTDPSAYLPGDKPMTPDEFAAMHGKKRPATGKPKKAPSGKTGRDGMEFLFPDPA